jgi:hypothetical protein
MQSSSLTYPTELDVECDVPVAGGVSLHGVGREGVQRGARGAHGVGDGGHDR